MLRSDSFRGLEEGRLAEVEEKGLIDAKTGSSCARLLLL